MSVICSWWMVSGAYFTAQEINLIACTILSSEETVG